MKKRRLFKNLFTYVSGDTSVPLTNRNRFSNWQSNRDFGDWPAWFERKEVAWAIGKGKSGYALFISPKK